MRRSLVKTALFASVAMAATPVHAAVLLFGAALSGANENPPVASPGAGAGLVTIDTTAATMRVQASFTNLLAPTTASHMHCCAPAPTNAGVATTLPSFPGFPLGVTAGSFDQTYNMTLASSYNPAFIAANGGTPLAAFAALQNGLLGRQAYLNIHTSQFPAGEIRGQLDLVVPEPASWALMIAGFGLAGAVMRRQRQSVRVRYG